MPQIGKNTNQFFLFEYIHCMPKFSSAKMLMYIISLLTGPYSVAWGSAGACVHVCVCVRERERERERELFLLSRRKEDSKCLVVNIAFYFHLCYLFLVLFSFFFLYIVYREKKLK